MFGAVWFEARMATDFDNRVVTCESLRVTASKFPDLDEGTVDKLSRYLEREFPKWDVQIF